MTRKIYQKIIVVVFLGGMMVTCGEPEEGAPPCLVVSKVFQNGQYIDYTYDNSSRLASVDNWAGNLRGYFSFEYDNVSRLSKIDRDGFNYVFEYSTTSSNVPLMIIKRYNTLGLEFRADSLETDRKNYPVRMLTGHGTYQFLEYDKGNVVTVISKDTPTSEPYVYVVIEYDNKRNPKGRTFGLQMFDFLFFYYYHTAFSQNNVQRLRIFSPNGDVIATHSFEYEYNADGYPVKSVQKVFDGLQTDPIDVNEVTYLYDCK